MFWSYIWGRVHEAPAFAADILALPTSKTLGTAALRVALDELGNGEEGANNRGPYVQKYRSAVDLKTAIDPGAWCASLVSYCIRKACAQLGRKPPIKFSNGAKRLYRNIGKAGQFVDAPIPGDFICWHRGKRGSWMGHIGIIERVSEGLVHTVEGNVGRYPARVRRFTHDVEYERLVGYARLPE